MILSQSTAPPLPLHSPVMNSQRWRWRWQGSSPKIGIVGCCFLMRLALRRIVISQGMYSTNHCCVLLCLAIRLTYVALFAISFHALSILLTNRLATPDSCPLAHSHPLLPPESADMCRRVQLRHARVCTVHIAPSFSILRFVDFPSSPIGDPPPSYWSLLTIVMIKLIISISMIKYLYYCYYYYHLVLRRNLAARGRWEEGKAGRRSGTSNVLGLARCPL